MIIEKSSIFLGNITHIFRGWQCRCLFFPHGQRVHKGPLNLYIKGMERREKKTNVSIPSSVLLSHGQCHSLDHSIYNTCILSCSSRSPSHSHTCAPLCLLLHFILKHHASSRTQKLPKPLEREVS